MANLAVVAKETPQERLQRLVEQAGELNRQKYEIDKTYNALRKEIESLMEFPTFDQPTKVTSDNFIATFEYATETRVDPQKLFALDQEAFWLLATVPVTKAKEALRKEEFHEVVTVSPKTTPTLLIKKRGKDE